MKVLTLSEVVCILDDISKITSFSKTESLGKAELDKLQEYEEILNEYMMQFLQTSIPTNETVLYPEKPIGETIIVKSEDSIFSRTLSIFKILEEYLNSHC